MTSLAITEMPLMGFGTFIGIEDKKAASEAEMLDRTETAVFNALKAGYRHFDCAANYGNEVAVGRAFQRAFASLETGGLGLKREDLWITTKGSITTLSSSLSNLGVDYVDLFLQHHPKEFESEESLTRMWTGMNSTLSSGRVRHIGVSNYYPGQLTRLIRVCEKNHLPLPYANEIELHPLNQEADLVEYCLSKSVRPIAYSPLGYTAHSMIFEAESLTAIAAAHGNTPAQVALAWNISRGVAVIPKSESLERMAENFGALSLPLSVDEMAAIKTADLGLLLTETANRCKELSEGIPWAVEDNV